MKRSPNFLTLSHPRLSLVLSLQNALQAGGFALIHQQYHQDYINSFVLAGVLTCDCVSLEVSLLRPNNPPTASLRGTF